MKKIRWGILATGKIARKFAQGLETLPDAIIQAVGSRSQASADAFADDFNIPNRHASYESLAADPEVDIIYIATPHNFHLACARICFEAGKSVLCEKPLAVNMQEAAVIVDLAKQKNLFLMEAMWTRYLPVWVAIKQWIDEGKIGKIRMIQADFSYQAEWDPKHRRINPDLAGGAILDVGIYPIALAYWLFGKEPVTASSTALIGKTGVDEQSAYLFGYDEGEIAMLASAVHSDGPKEAIIIGEKGRIRVPLFWKADTAIFEAGDQEIERIHHPYPASGLQYQAVAAMEALRNGKTEETKMPWNESLRIMRMMDRCRQQWGLRYPWEA